MTRWLVVTAFLAFASPAQAITPAQTLKAAQIAADVMGHPCQDQITIEMRSGMVDDDGSRLLGEYANCHITISTHAYRRLRGAWRPIGWRVFCSTVIHEFGHAAGLPDDYVDRASPMFWRITRVNPHCLGQDPATHP